MNRYDALERELTAWFVEMAAPRKPFYTSDIVQLTATVRQRPRWAFPERWFPMTVVAFGRRNVAPFPWRPIGLLAALVILLIAAAVFAGSQPRLPPPFGLAANGVVAYTQNGDILTVDPATGARTWITSGNENDHEPRWSLDGTRLAFLRDNSVTTVVDSAAIDVVVVVDREGSVIAKSRPIPGIDPDAVAWAPDGRSIAVGAYENIQLVDAVDGTVKWVNVGYDGLDFYWRPGVARELLFQGRTSEGIGLVVAAVDEPASASLILAAPSGVTLRPNGWTADGRRVVYTRIDEDAETVSVHVLEVDTGVEVEIDAAFAHVSNDGTRLLAIDPAGRPCVASVHGGPCIAIGEPGQTYIGMHAAAAHWAPDDGSIMVRVPAGDGLRGVLLDPTGGTNEQPSWLAADAESWQRLAR
ncbi:MAG TPA: hypothetical protein VK867_08725 [Candidatus Limnocylindrales bacterium]|nr:hypothetical protein [Candidatus Limnocylindrales bacterium]